MMNNAAVNTHEHDFVYTCFHFAWVDTKKWKCQIMWKLHIQPFQEPPGKNCIFHPSSLFRSPKNWSVMFYKTTVSLDLSRESLSKVLGLNFNVSWEKLASQLPWLDEINTRNFKSPFCFNIWWEAFQCKLALRVVPFRKKRAGKTKTPWSACTIFRDHASFHEHLSRTSCREPGGLRR